MDKNQADAIARAILEPDPKLQENLRLKRAEEAVKLVGQRRIALFGLVGYAAGAAFGHIVLDKIAGPGLFTMLAALAVARFWPARDAS